MVPSPRMGLLQGSGSSVLAISSQRFPSSTYSMPELPSATCVAVMSP
jgi:hypothetical protein